MELGTWTELLVGLGTIAVSGFLGYLAVKEARLASRLAEHAATLQERANELAEAAIHVAFTAELSAEIYHAGDEPGQRFDAWLTLSADPGAASAIIHKVVTAGAFLGELSSTSIPVGEMFGTWDVEPTSDTDLPRRIHPGEELVFRNPWPSFEPTRTDGRWAYVSVFYSVTASSPVRDVRVKVGLPRTADAGTSQ